MRKLVGITFAMVMFFGSISPAMALTLLPVQPSEEYGDDKEDWYMQDPKSLRAQIEQGFKNLQCQNESHVLVERTNGKLACVFESTSEKLGWKILTIYS